MCKHLEVSLLLLWCIFLGLYHPFDKNKHFLSVLLELSLIFSCWEMDYRAENTRLQVSRLESSSALIVVEKDLPLKEPSLACPSFSRRLVKSCL